MEFTGIEPMLREIEKLDDKLARSINQKACNDAALIMKAGLKTVLNTEQAQYQGSQYHGSKPGAAPFKWTGNLYKSPDIKIVKPDSRSAYAIVGHNRKMEAEQSAFTKISLAIRGKFRPRKAKAVGPHAHLLEMGVPARGVAARPYMKPTFDNLKAAMQKAIEMRVTVELYA